MSAYYEADAEGTFDPVVVVTSCIESGASSLLIDSHALPAEFFDLSTGIAGELLHKLGTYRMRLAGVVPDASVHSPRFQEFHRETNTGKQFRFFATRQESDDWLESG